MVSITARYMYTVVMSIQESEMFNGDNNGDRTHIVKSESRY